MRVREGMEVYTDSERLKKYRRMMVEMLFAEGNHICSVCVVERSLRTATLGRVAGHRPYQSALPESAARSGRYRTSGSRLTPTAVFCVRAACASAAKLKAHTPGM